MNGVTVYISWEWALGIIGTLVLIAWKANGRFTSLETSLEWLADRIKDLKIDIDNVRNQAFRNTSPVALTDKGTLWLKDSGLKKYIDANLSTLKSSCSSKRETNAYEVQEYVFSLFDKMSFPKETDDKLKQYAYEQGISMEVLRRIGAIYFRDICLVDFKMDIKDIDRKNEK
jgi:hypothetical protein